MADKAARLKNDRSEQNKVSLAIMSILQYAVHFSEKNETGLSERTGVR